MKIFLGAGKVWSGNLYLCIMRIGITVPDKWQVTGNYNNYFEWIKDLAESVPLSEKEDLVADIDALILSGGGDLNARTYGEENIRTSEVSDKRDEFEFLALEKALKRRIPVLGICRGMQLINVFFRGSLWQDIDEFGAVTSDHTDLKGDTVHKVRILKDTMLYEIIGEEIIEVNSHHHESVKKTGEDLKISAFSLKDRIIEGIENQELKVIAVQWHPERWKSHSSDRLLKGFLKLTRQF